MVKKYPTMPKKSPLPCWLVSPLIQAHLLCQNIYSVGTQLKWSREIKGEEILDGLVSPPKPLPAHVSALRREVRAKRPVGKRPNVTMGLWTRQKQPCRDAPCLHASHSWKVSLITLLEVGDQISGPDFFTVPIPSCVSEKEISYNSLLGMELTWKLILHHCQHFEINIALLSKNEGQVYCKSVQNLPLAIFVC